MTGQRAWRASHPETATRDPMPDVLRRPDYERVRAEFLGGRGEFPGRAAPPRADVHVHFGMPGHLVKLGEQPAFQRLGVPGHPHDLPGQRLAVDP